jgi:hypothetical protein
MESKIPLKFLKKSKTSKIIFDLVMGEVDNLNINIIEGIVTLRLGVLTKIFESKSLI